MLFNSKVFIIFFLIVYSLYLILDHKKQNRLLLIASYIFYGWWSWKFCILMLVSTIIDYFCGIKIYETTQKKKWKAVSIVSNLSMLIVFKYFNFFVAELTHAINAIGLNTEILHLNIALPIGISFYTFQTMSYSWDIYRKEVKPIYNFFDFALFVSFFPQLVAGPIERAKNLIPQILNKRKVSIDKFYEGSYLIFWGFVKKIYIADTLALHVNSVFNNWNYGANTWVDVVMAVWMFAFQIYCDFSGYTDIARGISKLMGFDLMINFNLPYFATSPTDFWRRWHISLSSWLRDYLYIPLGGSRGGNLLTYRNLFITMAIGGLWHGASWHFLLWGIYQGAVLATHRLWKTFWSKYALYERITETKSYKTIAIITTFMITCYGWLIFRVDSLQQLIEMNKTVFYGIGEVGKEIVYPAMLFNAIWLLFFVQLYQHKKQDLLSLFKTKRWILRSFVYVASIYLLIGGMTNNVKEFIYFQF
jgi:alginate O-acetyltransferase complex protein AlgI